MSVRALPSLSVLADAADLIERMAMDETRGTSPLDKCKDCGHDRKDHLGTGVGCVYCSTYYSEPWCERFVLDKEVRIGRDTARVIKWLRDEAARLEEYGALAVDLRGIVR